MKILKSFESTRKFDDSICKITCNAIVDHNCRNKYYLKFRMVKHVSGKLDNKTISYVYFDNIEQLVDEFNYHYNLNKDDLFTTETIVY